MSTNIKKTIVKTNLPFGEFDYNVMLTVLDHFDLTLEFDDTIEKYVNSNNVFFKVEGGQTLVAACNSLYRSLYNIDHAKEFINNG